VAIPQEGLSVKLAQFLADQAMRNDATRPGTAQIVMLRGCRANRDGSLSVYGDPNRCTDHYDDRLVVFGLKAGGQPYLWHGRASSRPGLRWVKDPSYYHRGAPFMQPGQMLYQRGRHLTHPEAMVQAAACCVVRDYDQDGRVEFDADRIDYPFGTGINIHAGGTSSSVGLYSSGCQIIWGGWGGDGWRTFHDLIYKTARSQKLFHYAVTDFAFFGAWHDHPDERQTTYSVLRFGSYGKRVRDLQTLLVRAGYLGASLVDGEFGPRTDRAVRDFQRARRLTMNGAVTQKVLNLLRGGD